ncbi:MAG TPA: VWA domain-containing protein, partial [Bryobacteraceae bacterium]
LVESIRKMHGALARKDMEEVQVSKMDRNGQIDSYSGLLGQRQQRQTMSAPRNINDGFATLQAFEQLAWAYSGIPGRKTVLWLTSGFPLMQEVPNGPTIFGRPVGTHMSGELLPEFQRAFTAMNKANVMVYPVDVNGLPLEEMWDVSQPAGLYIHPELAHLGPPLLADTAAENRDGMKELAHRTGGKSCTAGNNLNYCLDQALAESSDYYLLGFYVSQQQRKAGWHKLKASVSVDHGEVRARSTYFLHALGAPPEREQEEDLRSAMLAGVNYTGILFSVEPAAQPRTAASPIVFKVSVPASSILLMPGQEKLSFDVIAIPLSSRGVPVAKESRIVKLDIAPNATAKALAQGWNLINSVAGNSSTTAVKVVIRDNATGRIGSVVFPVSGGTGS